MPIRSDHVTVTGAATRLDVFTPVTGLHGQALSISVRNAGTVPVWAGGAGVTAATGYEIPANGGVLAIVVEPPAQLWGIVSSGSAVCHVIMTNVA